MGKKGSSCHWELSAQPSRASVCKSNVWDGAFEDVCISVSRNFITFGVRATGWKPDRLLMAIVFGSVTVLAILKHLVTLVWDMDRLKMLVNITASWATQLFRTLNRFKFRSLMRKPNGKVKKSMRKKPWKEPDWKRESIIFWVTLDSVIMSHYSS